MTADPRIDSYAWAGGREPLLRFGPDSGPVVVLALPLFEEANRTRAFGVGILHALAARGIGGVLPELPGQGESEVATEALRLGDLRAATAAVPGTHLVAIRSGALLADARPCWMLAPQDGADLLREVRRLATGSPDAARVLAAGNVLTRALLEELHGHVYPGKGRREADRAIRLIGDPRPADQRVDGQPLWRRAEPGNDLSLAQTLAVDIADWIAACAG